MYLPEHDNLQTCERSIDCMSFGNVLEVRPQCRLVLGFIVKSHSVQCYKTSLSFTKSK